MIGYPHIARVHMRSARREELWMMEEVGRSRWGPADQHQREAGREIVYAVVALLEWVQQS